MVSNSVSAVCRGLGMLSVVGAVGRFGGFVVLIGVLDSVAWFVGVYVGRSVGFM
jgi:hypothetical protein